MPYRSVFPGSVQFQSVLHDRLPPAGYTNIIRACEYIIAASVEYLAVTLLFNNYRQETVDRFHLWSTPGVARRSRASNISTATLGLIIGRCGEIGYRNLGEASTGSLNWATPGWRRPAATFVLIDRAHIVSQFPISPHARRARLHTISS